MREAIVLRQALRTTKRVRSGPRPAQVQGWINEWGAIHDIPDKYRKRQARKKEGNLRSAIDLYHLSDYFFPVKASTDSVIGANSAPAASSSTSPPSGAGSSIKEQQQQPAKNESERFDETLDAHIRNSVMGTSTPTSTYSNLDATFLDMKLAHMALYNKARDDEVAFGSGISNPTYDASSSSLTDRLLGNMWPSDRTQRQSSPFLASGASATTAANHHQPSASMDDDASSLGSTLPPIEDEEAVKLYIAETARRRAQKARSSSAGMAPSTEIYDARGAQVRDALYGTVGGKLPGLEVLLDRTRQERVARREKKHRDFYVDKHIKEHRAGPQKGGKHQSTLESDSKTR